METTPGCRVKVPNIGPNKKFDLGHTHMQVHAQDSNARPMRMHTCPPKTAPPIFKVIAPKTKCKLDRNPEMDT